MNYTNQCHLQKLLMLSIGIKSLIHSIRQVSLFSPFLMSLFICLINILLVTIIHPFYLQQQLQFVSFFNLQSLTTFKFLLYYGFSCISLRVIYLYLDKISKFLHPHSIFISFYRFTHFCIQSFPLNSAPFFTYSCPHIFYLHILTSYCFL